MAPPASARRTPPPPSEARSPWAGSAKGPDLEGPRTFVNRRRPLASFRKDQPVEAHTTTSLTGSPTPGPAPRLPERPVFVADHGRRHALIRAMVVLGAALIAAWLIALVAGALGWGNLPGVPFSKGSDHGQPATSASQEKPATEQAATQRQGTSSPANQAVSPSSAGGRASPGPSGSASPAPHGSQSPAGALSTPAGSGASAGAGTQRSPGSRGSPPNPGTTTPSNGAGSGPGNGGGGSAHPSTTPRQSGQPALTPSGNVPAQDAYGGNPNALVNRNSGNPGY